MDVHLKGQDIVHRNLLSSGLNPQIIGITYKIIEKTLSLINNTGDLRTLIEKLNLKSNFFTGHSLAGNFISQMIMNELEIGNHENQLKVSMAFFFHDISLAIIDEDIQQLECELEYDVPKIKSKHHAFYCHPIESSTFLYAFKEIPSDTITIINQHHERPSGKGFPKGLWGKQTFKLSCIFITAHYFVGKLYESGWSPNNVKQTLNEMENTFNEGHYTIIFEKLRDLFKD